MSKSYKIEIIEGCSHVLVLSAEPFSLPISWRNWRKLLMKRTTQTCTPEKCSPWRLSCRRTEYRCVCVCIMVCADVYSVLNSQSKSPHFLNTKCKSSQNRHKFQSRSNIPKEMFSQSAAASSSSSPSSSQRLLHTHQRPIQQLSVIIS